MNKYRLIFTIVFISVFHFQVASASVVNNKVKANVDTAAVEITDIQLLIKKLKNISSFKAEFSQIIQDTSDLVLQQGSGYMVVKRPEKFYWHAKEPYEQELISDGDVLWIYDRDLEQAIKKKVDKEVGNTPALLLSGDPQKISSQFSVRREVIEDTSMFYLTPLDSSSLFNLMRVTFKAEQLEEMYLEDGLGQRTVIDFLSPVSNGAIDDGLFVFDPPANIDVISEL